MITVLRHLHYENLAGVPSDLGADSATFGVSLSVPRRASIFEMYVFKKSYQSLLSIHYKVYVRSKPPFVVHGDNARAVLSLCQDEPILKLVRLSYLYDMIRPQEFLSPLN